SAMKATLNASSTDTTKIFKEFDQIATDIIEKAQSQAAAVERIVVFCKPEAFSAIRFSAGMANAFQYVSPLEEGNVVYQRRD
ncbi:phage capsid protein, partial [Escherichia coli]|nr:phage capsid protein [Escherichia coli]